MAAMNLSFPDTLKIIATALASIGGGGFLVMAMSSWLGKVWAQRLMQKDIAKHESDLEALKSRLEGVNKKIQSELDKTVFVHRIQFETEFKALSEIWAKIVAVRASLAALRPQLEVNPPGQNTDLAQMDKFNRTFGKFSLIFGELRMAVHNQSPFYATHIYAELGEFINTLSDAEAVFKLTDHKPFTADWYRQGENNWASILRKADGLSEMIRGRIESFSLYRD
jgi:hypothetical protein